MLVLGIETSCDETAVAVVENGTRVHSNVISSSQDLFKDLGGVIPEKAARHQIECMQHVIAQALKQADVTFDAIDLIAVTKGPGLTGSLLVGTTTARTLHSLYNAPLVGVHHTLGHLSSVWLEKEVEPSFPCLCLSASGGHTDLWYRTSHTDGKLISRTRDDAAGEAFDKGASMLGLSYPGGPSISKKSESGDSTAFSFPIPLAGRTSSDFSFSGLKTALKVHIDSLDPAILQDSIADLCASYQHGLCRHLEYRLTQAVEDYPNIKEIHLVGGVSANSYLRSFIQAKHKNIKVLYPEKIAYCTDNAAMIAAAGFFIQDQQNTEFITSASIPLEFAIVSQQAKR